MGDLRAQPAPELKALLHDRSTARVEPEPFKPLDTNNDSDLYEIAEIALKLIALLPNFSYEAIATLTQTLYARRNA